MREYTQFYINGQWVDPVTPKTLEVLDPATEEPCATISLGTEADVDLAVAAAKAAFETFSQTSVEERVGMLERMAEIFQRRIGEIAEAIRLEMGAPIKLASTHSFTSMVSGLTPSRQKRLRCWIRPQKNPVRRFRWGQRQMSI